MAELPRIVVPLITPLKDDQSVDEKGLRTIIDYVTRHKVQGLFALSTTGEYLGLPERTRAELLESVLDANSGRLPVWVGIGDISTVRVLENISKFYTPGISGFVVTTPFFYGHLTQEELVNHFHAVADASEVPIVLYNLPQNTQLNLEAQTVLELSRHANIVGLKDSSGDIAYVNEIISLIGRDSPFRVYEGDERIALDCLHVGAYGVVSGIANIIPNRIVELKDAFLRNDDQLSRELQEYITSVSIKVGRDYWLRGLKAIAAGMGVSSPLLLKPWRVTLTNEDPSLTDLIFELQNDGLLPNPSTRPQ